MGQEHAPETIWQGHEPYCSGRLSFAAVAERLSVVDSMARRWAGQDGRRRKREAIAQTEAGIRADKVLAHSKPVKTLPDSPKPGLAFAVASLEELALKEAEAARQALDHAPQDKASMVIETPHDAVLALRQAVERKLDALLTRPKAVDLKAVQVVKKCFDLLSGMEQAGPLGNRQNPETGKGISAAVHKRLPAVLSGKADLGKVGRGLKTTLPARPFLDVNDGDLAEMAEIIGDHMKKAFER